MLVLLLVQSRSRFAAVLYCLCKSYLHVLLADLLYRDTSRLSLGDHAMPCLRHFPIATRTRRCRRQLEGDARSLALRIVDGSKRCQGFEGLFEGVPVEATFGELFNAPEPWACESLAQSQVQLVDQTKCS